MFKKISKLFTSAFIKLGTEELILELINNVFFRLDNIKSEIDFNCKIIAYLSRLSYKGVPKKWQKYFRDRLNRYFDQDWNEKELSLIYTYLGNDVNRELCKQFILSGFDLNILKRNRK